jgi:hypothetical protein
MLCSWNGHFPKGLPRFFAKSYFFYSGPQDRITFAKATVIEKGCITFAKATVIEKGRSVS